MRFKTFLENEITWPPKDGKPGEPPESLLNYNCSSRQLTSLKGCPKIVEQDFECRDNYLTNLVDGPTYVGASYYCRHNHLTSLKGAPKIVGKNPTNRTWSVFNCSYNMLTSLEHCPEVIDGSLEAQGNNITSLHNIHKHLKEVGEERYINLKSNPIESHVLGLLLIKNLLEVSLDNKKVESIINKHLKGDRDVVECQEELLNKDLDDYAQL